MTPAAVERTDELGDAELEAVTGGLTDNQKLGIAVVIGGPIVWLGFGTASGMADGNSDHRT
jgi:hypothetical protein